MATLVRETGITEQSTILDVGGSIHNWAFLDFRLDATFLNIRNDGQSPLVIADGCRLPFADKAFDVVFSNSLIEHQSTSDRPKKFAAECQRVGNGYFIQTPNKHFPIEPHRLAPWYNSWPAWIKLRAHILTPWGWMSGASRQESIDFHAEHLPLDYADMMAMFDNGRIVRERAAGLTKSIIAARHPQ